MSYVYLIPLHGFYVEMQCPLWLTVMIRDIIHLKKYAHVARLVVCCWLLHVDLPKLYRVRTPALGLLLNWHNIKQPWRICLNEWVKSKINWWRYHTSRSFNRTCAYFECYTVVWHCRFRLEARIKNFIHLLVHHSILAGFIYNVDSIMPASFVKKNTIRVRRAPVICRLLESECSIFSV